MQRVAANGSRKAFRFPRAFHKDDRLAFSFSGLKTAIRYAALGQPGASTPVPPLTPQRIADLAASFQEAVVDVLVAKCRLALRQSGYKTLCVGGGVAANARLRERLKDMAAKEDVEIHIAPMSLCTDNAAMAAIAWELLAAGRIAELDADVTPGLVRAPRT